ncbi:hypothetical protein CUMW_037610 [Citrus unshiu]|nr:hypothetical protein CUMW_037610 [Citrus unshiu]
MAVQIILSCLIYINVQIVSGVYNIDILWTESAIISGRESDICTGVALSIHQWCYSVLPDDLYSLKGPSMIESLYPTAFPLKHQQKDLRLALGLAESVSQSTPIAAAANELYKVAKSHGLSDEDFSAVIEALKAKK